MAVEQVEKINKHSLIYQSYLWNTKSSLLLDQIKTNKYIVLFKFALYPKNITKGENIWKKN